MPTLYSATMSLDGYLAGLEGDMSWLAPHLGAANPTARRLLERVGCLLIGRKTFAGDDPNAGTDSEGAFGGQYDGPAVVLTSRPEHRSEATDGVEFSSDVSLAVARSLELAGDGYVNILGAATARSCLDAGLLDEVLLFVAPVLLGDGVRVLERRGHPPVRLTRMPGETEHWYSIDR